MDAGESEDAFRFAQVAPRVEVGRVEFQVAEGPYGPVARGGGVLDSDGLTGVDGMGNPSDVAVRQVLRVSGDDLRSRAVSAMRWVSACGRAVAELPPRSAVMSSGVRSASRARRILPALKRHTDAVPLVSRSAIESSSAESRADGVPVTAAVRSAPIRAVVVAGGSSRRATPRWEVRDRRRGPAAEVTRAVREMERARDDKKLRKPGQSWTLQAWLEHWVENIAKRYVSENTYDGYEVDVRVHLVPAWVPTSSTSWSPSTLSASTGRCRSPGAPPAPPTTLTGRSESPWVRPSDAVTSPPTWPRSPRLRVSKKRTSSRSRSRRFRASSSRPPNSATARGGSSPWPSGSAKGKRSVSTGKTSTWTLGTSPSARTASAPSTPTAAQTPRAVGRPATAPGNSRPAANTSPPSPEPDAERSASPTR